MPRIKVAAAVLLLTGCSAPVPLSRQAVPLATPPAPEAPPGTCVPTSGQMLLDTNAQGEPLPSTERALGGISWRDEGEGRQFYLVQVGNNVVSWEVTGGQANRAEVAGVLAAEASRRGDHGRDLPGLQNLDNQQPESGRREWRNPDASRGEVVRTVRSLPSRSVSNAVVRSAAGVGGPILTRRGTGTGREVTGGSSEEPDGRQHHARQAHRTVALLGDGAGDAEFLADRGAGEDSRVSVDRSGGLPVGVADTTGASAPTLTRRGKTDTGLGGDIHFPYELTGQLWGRDDTRWVYIGERGTSLWVVDGATVGRSRMVASELGISANRGALARLTDGRRVLCLPVSDGFGQPTTVRCYVVADPADPGIRGDQPGTWGAPVVEFPVGWGVLTIDSPQRDGQPYPWLDGWVVMDVPSGGGGGQGITSLVSVETGEVVPIGTGGADEVVIGRGPDGRVITIENDTTGRRWRLWEVTQPVTVSPITGWIGHPATGPGGVPVLAGASLAGDVLTFGDQTSQTVTVYDIRDPENPRLLSDVTDWWWATYADPNPHHIPYGVIDLGGGWVLSLAYGNVYTVGLDCVSPPLPPEIFADGFESGDVGAWQ